MIQKTTDGGWYHQVDHFEVTVLEKGGWTWYLSMALRDWHKCMNEVLLRRVHVIGNKDSRSPEPAPVPYVTLDNTSGDSAMRII
jgi:hypothetical protein